MRSIFLERRNIAVTCLGIFLESAFLALTWIFMDVWDAPYDAFAQWWLNGLYFDVRWVALIVYVAAFFVARRARADARVILCFSVLFGATLLATPYPLASPDAFGYSFYGRAIPVHDAHPYAVVPIAYRHDEVFPALDPMWRVWNNPYGPLWTIISTAVATFTAADYLLTVKGFMLLSAGFGVGIFWLAMRLRAQVAGANPMHDPALVLLLTWNPLLLWEFAQSGHNDAAMIFFLLLTVYLFSRGKDSAAAVAFACSAMIKYVTLAFTPIFLLYLLFRRGAGRPRRRDIARFLLIVGGITIALCVAFWGNGLLLESLRRQSGLFERDLSGVVPYVLQTTFAGAARSVEDPLVIAAARTASLAVFAAAAAALYAWLAKKKRPDDTRSLVRAMTAFLAVFFTAGIFWFMPWYFTWIIPLLVILKDHRAVLLISVFALLSRWLPVAAIQAVLLFIYLVLHVRYSRRDERSRPISSPPAVPPSCRPSS